MPIQRVALAAIVLALACRADAGRAPQGPELDNFLSGYAKEYQRLNYASSQAEWESNTHIVEGDSSNAIRTRRANEELARFVGSTENIARIRGFLEHRDRLSPLQARELDVMLYNAAEKPQTAADIVSNGLQPRQRRPRSSTASSSSCTASRSPPIKSTMPSAPARSCPSGLRSGRLRKRWARP